MPSPPPIGDDQQPLRNDGKGVFLPEERTPRTTWQESLAKRLRIQNVYARIVLAEFLGTFTLIAIGCGSIAQEVLSDGKNGNIVTVMFGWGIAVAMGVYASGGYSGGHINPAFSTAMALMGRISLDRLPFYYIGQYIGATTGAFCVWAVYLDALNLYSGSNRFTAEQKVTLKVNESFLPTAGIYGTFPRNESITTAQCFLDQVFATMMLVIIALAITDKRNLHPVPTGMCPFVIGFGVTGLVASYVQNCGAALNPARDFGPRLFTAMAGWGAPVFSIRNNVWFLVPIFGPHIGAVVGAMVYNICVGLHLPDPIDITSGH